MRPVDRAGDCGVGDFQGTYWTKDVFGGGTLAIAPPTMVSGTPLRSWADLMDEEDK